MEDAPFDVKSILRAGLSAGGKESEEGRQRVFITPPSPWEDEAEEDSNNDSSKPRKVHCHSKWKLRQDALC